MNKLLRRILNRDKERYKVPRKVQDIIPVKAMWPDGMFLTGRNRYNKLFMFTDINFAVASNDVKKNIIEEYAELINSFGSDFSYKLSFNNRALNRMDFEDDVLMEKLRDTLDFYRGEFNGLMTGLASGINAIVQDKYVMIAVYEKDAETARNRLNRAGAEVRSYYAKMGSIDRELDASARLRILHDFFIEQCVGGVATHKQDATRVAAHLTITAQQVEAKQPEHDEETEQCDAVDEDEAEIASTVAVKT